MRHSDWLLLGIIAVLFAISIVTAMAETAFTKMNRVRAMTLEEEGRKGAARLLRLLETPEWTLNVLLLFMMAAHFAVASLVAIIVEHHFGGAGVIAGTVDRSAHLLRPGRGGAQDLRHPAHRRVAPPGCPASCGWSAGSRRCGSSPGC